MATSLYLGGGLGHLAAIYLVGTIVGEITRARAALRVCPELRISFKASSWAEGKKMVRFGGNTILVGMPPFILVQTTNVLVASALGPAALAVFSRPLVLLRHLEAFLNKFSYVLTPMAGSLQSSGQDEDIRRLFVQSTRIGVAMTLPAVLILLVFGDVILNVWMGPEYAHIELIATFALGYFLPVAQSTGLRVLVGLNRHGRIGVWSVSVSLLVLVAGVIVLNMTEWSLVRAALLITLPLMLTQGIVTPVVACRMLKIPLSDYLRRVFLAPGLCGSVFASVLLGARILIPDAGLAALAVGIALGAAILAVLYWRYVLTPEQRVRLGKRLPVLRAASARGKA
jgi:O-antigen/teichoic acid export membrane protein